MKTFQAPGYVVSHRAKSILNDQFDIIIDCEKENRLVCLLQKISFCSSFSSLQRNKKIVKNQER